MQFNFTEDTYRRPDNDINRLVQMMTPPPVELSAAPTTAGKQLPNHLDWGIFGTTRYQNLFGTVYSQPLTAV